jgi:hypothetical protein
MDIGRFGPRFIPSLYEDWEARIIWPVDVELVSVGTSSRRSESSVNMCYHLLVYEAAKRLP